MKRVIGWVSITPFRKAARVGDEVDDTPAELTASFLACPVGLDTCSSPGLDPTDNYMDYSGDACWTTFTAGQNERMTMMFALYRYAQ